MYLSQWGEPPTINWDIAKGTPPPGQQSLL